MKEQSGGMKRKKEDSHVNEQRRGEEKDPVTKFNRYKTLESLGAHNCNKYFISIYPSFTSEVY